MGASTEIKIPEMHYVTFNPQTDQPPLGFLVPDGSDAAATKRKATADRWGNDNIKAITTKNEPMSGFILLTSERRHRTSNVVWRILDPRGFVLEITSENLEQIIRVCTIEEGEITVPCLWGRHGSTNVLLPTSDPIYKAAQENTKRASKTVSIKNVNPGDKVLLHNGERGVYMGLFHPVGRGYDPVNTGNQIIDKPAKMEVSKKVHIFYLEETQAKTWRSFTGPAFRMVGTPKISEILEVAEEALSVVDAERTINDMFHNFSAQMTDARGDSCYKCVGVLAKTITDFGPIKLDQIQDVRQLEESRVETTRGRSIYIPGWEYIAKLDADDCETWVITNTSRLNRRTTEIECTEIHNTFMDGVIKYKSTRRSYHGYRDPVSGPSTVKFCIDHATWYLPYFEVTSPTGNVVKFPLT